MCRTGAPWRTCRSATASGSPSTSGRPLVRERRDRVPVHGIAGGTDHRGGDPGAPPWTPRAGRSTSTRPGHRKRGLPVRRVSRGGRNTKVRVVSDSESTLVRIHLSPATSTTRPTGAAHGPRVRGDPTRLPAESFGLTPVVPPKRNRTAPWDYDREAYKGRNMVRTRLQPHEAPPQGRHPLRQARRDLPTPTSSSSPSPST